MNNPPEARRSIHHNKATPPSSVPGNRFIKSGSMMLAMVGLFLVFSGIAFLLGYRHLNITREKVLMADKTAASLLADVLFQHEWTVVEILQSYATRPAFIAAVKQRSVPNALKRLMEMKKHHNIDLTFVTDPQGVLWLNYPFFPKAIGTDLSGRDWYKGISSRWEPYISEVFQLIVADKPLAVAICVPVFDERRKVVGILGNSHRLEFLAKAIEGIPLIPDTGVTIVDRTGDILYSNRYPYRETVTRYQHFPALDQDRKEKRQQIEDELPRNQGALYLSMAPVGDIGWTVIVERRLDDIYRAESGRFAEIGGAAFLLFVLSGLVLAYMRRVALFRKTKELLAAQQAVLESEELIVQSRRDWENIFQAISHPTVILDPRHAIIAANKAVMCSTGLSEAEVFGKKCYEIFHGKGSTAPPEGCPMEKMLATGKMEPFEGEMEALGGTYIVSCTPVFDKQGHLDKVIHIAHDITARKQAEEHVRASEKRLSDIIEFFPDATFIIDKDGRVMAWNRAVETMTGVKAEEMLGKGDYEYALPFYGERRPILIDLAIHPRPELGKYYTNIEQKGDVLFGESYSPRLRGRQAYLSATASVLRDAKGEIVAVIECVRDDTEKKHAQENLRQAEERYRSIFDNAQEGIYRSTPEGRIIMANQAMAKMFGYDSPEELMNTVTDAAHQLYVDPEERTKIKEMIESHGFVRNYETQYYRKDGCAFWVSMTMKAIRDVEGKILYYEGIDEDITERRLSFDRLRRSLGGTVRAIASIVERRDPYTAGHQQRVADLARAMAKEMGLPNDHIDGLRIAGTIHDLGKISVPAEILSRPRKLTDMELSLIRMHAQSGYDILEDIEFPWPIARMILEHHERMDGSGYPNGLTGDHLLLESRILAVADVVESMASYRPYRPALGLDQALEEINNNRDILYDPMAVDACLRLFKEHGYKMME